MLTLQRAVAIYSPLFRQQLTTPADDVHFDLKALGRTSSAQLDK